MNILRTSKVPQCKHRYYDYDGKCCAAVTIIHEKYGCMETILMK